MPETYKNFINGRWLASDSGQTYEQQNPADLTEVTGIWQKSNADDVSTAVAAAEKAFSIWSSLNVYKRAEFLKSALALMRQRITSIAAVITAENGKTSAESKAEIASAAAEMEFQINEGLRLGGEIRQSAHEGVLAIQIRRPLGVTVIIAPWNFPFNVPCRKVTPALITGNTCIFKPAGLTPGVGREFVKLFEDAGLPAGVLNFITGSGSMIGDALISDSRVKAVSFTGSTEVGMAIHKKAAENLIRTQLEMGGKNPIVVLADADLVKAADAAALAAYACAGQWCTSTSRAIVERSVLNEFIHLLSARVKNIIVGRGNDPAVTMGPVCGKRQYENILAGIARGKAEGAKLSAGGNCLTEDKLAKGCFIQPTVFAGVTPEMFLAQEEIFGPVLSVMAADDFEQAVQLANDVRFGLSSSIYTHDLEKALTFVERTEVGVTHVNMPTAVKEPQMSFGGIKYSGHGIPEAGHTGVEFFTEHKVAYVRFR